MKMTGTKQPKKWLSAGEVGAYCQVSTATVRRWIKNRDLPAIRLPHGHFRIDLADFRDFLERHSLPVRDEFFKSEGESEEKDT